VDEYLLGVVDDIEKRLQEMLSQLEVAEVVQEEEVLLLPPLLVRMR
jgi:hypothetical protein